MVNLDELKQCEHSKMICDPNAYNNNNTIICFPLKSNQIKKRIEYNSYKNGKRYREKIKRANNNNKFYYFTDSLNL